jgi:hypothetical protein
VLAAAICELQPVTCNLSYFSPHFSFDRSTSKNPFSTSRSSFTE